MSEEKRKFWIRVTLVLNAAVILDWIISSAIGMPTSSKTVMATVLTVMMDYIVIMYVCGLKVMILDWTIGMLDKKLAQKEREEREKDEADLNKTGQREECTGREDGEDSLKQKNHWKKEE